MKLLEENMVEYYHNLQVGKDLLKEHKIYWTKNEQYWKNRLEQTME